MALQMDGVAEITSGREAYDAATAVGGRVDGLVDGGRIESLSVPVGPESSYV